MVGLNTPHNFATKEEYKRSCQEELSEFLQDADGNRASRMALQSEQHIKREKSVPNIQYSPSFIIC
jgi:glycine dehydrogenase